MVTRAGFVAASLAVLVAFAAPAATGTKAVMVAYRGLDPSINDLAAGVVDAVFDQTVPMIAIHTGGNARAMAVSGAGRLPQIPDVPTFAEGGVPAFDLTVWNALAAPKGTPPAIVGRLEASLAKALADGNVKARLANLAANAPTEAEAGRPALGTLVARDVDRLGRLVESAGSTSE